MFSLDPDVAATLDEYVRMRGPRLVRTAFLLTGDRQLAEDLVQNALASAMVSWRRLREVADLDAYIYTTLVHTRSRGWRRRWNEEVPSAELPETAGPDDTARIEGYHDLLTVLRRLPTRQREAVVLRYFEDLTEAQVARVLGCSVGTVKSQTARGLAKLRVALEVRPVDGRPADGGNR